MHKHAAPLLAVVLSVVALGLVVSTQTRDSESPPLEGRLIEWCGRSTDGKTCGGKCATEGWNCQMMAPDLQGNVNCICVDPNVVPCDAELAGPTCGGTCPTRSGVCVPEMSQSVPGLKVCGCKDVCSGKYPGTPICTDKDVNTIVKGGAKCGYFSGCKEASGNGEECKRRQLGIECEKPYRCTQSAEGSEDGRCVLAAPPTTSKPSTRL